MDARTEAPRPGPLTRYLMARRLSPSQRELLLSELDELYQHRLASEGRSAADRWARREHRRWAMHLLRGGVAESMVVSDAFQGGGRPGGGLVHDVRHNLRGLRRTPLLAAALVLTVGLGIGGTTLVFSVVHSVLIAPLPYPGAERMVLLRTVNGSEMWGTSMADLDALYGDPPDAFDAIAGYTYRTSTITLPEGVELVRSKWVTDNYFAMLDIRPTVGRAFTPEEGRPGGAPAVLVTEAFRERAFGSDADAVGRALDIDGRPHTVVGVLPDRLGPLDRVDVFPVLAVEAPSRKGPFYFQMIGRVRAGVDAGVAREQLDAVARRQFPVWRDSFTLETATLGFVDLKEILVGDASRALLIVLTGVGFLLLIASANAASLLVARGLEREREVSIRAALGASGRRLYQLLLSEAALLAGGGAVLGFTLVWLGVDLVRRMGEGRLPRVEEVAVTAPVLGFFAGVTLASWALFGVVAAAAAVRRRTEGVGTTAARSTASCGARRVRQLLVATQFAISIPLLVGAGLLGRSLDRLRSEDFGFDPHNLVSMLVSLPPTRYADGDAVVGFWADALPRIEALPDVLEAGLADARPPVRWPQSNNFELEDRAPDPDEPNLQAPWITADPGYFEALGIRLLEGTSFTDPLSDTMRAVVVDEAWSERFYPGQSPLGRRLRSGGCTIDGCPYSQVVGVVSNVKTTGLDDEQRTGTIYFDFRRGPGLSTNLHLRTRGDPLEVVPAIRRVIGEIDATVPVAEVMTAEDVASESLAGRRYTSTIVGMLAAVALLLSVVGVYGAMSYYVRQHRRDIGIRMALGGAPGPTLRMIVARGMRLAAVGTLAGVAGALLLTRYMTGLLYEVTATDPTVFVIASLGTLGVALAATAVPGRAAATTDPVQTLREE